MDDSNRTKETTSSTTTATPDLVGLIKSWIPWRSEPSNVSRDFWMPDRSCRVCYECDSQFNFFNRRHHCRLCGRIFCAKCTSHCVSAPSETPQQQWDTAIRVCDYCHKQWQLASVENGVAVAATDLDPRAFSTSPSTNSFVSVQSSNTSDSSSCTFLSLSNSSGQSPCKKLSMETSPETQSNPAAMSNDHMVDDWSQGQPGLFQNRTEYDGKEFGMSHFGSSPSPLSEVYGYFGHVQYDDMGSEYKSRKVHPDGDAVHEQTNTSPLYDSLDSQAFTEEQQLRQEDFEHTTGDECEAPSSLYVAEDVDAEPVDFESNILLWLPPEPEDEEDDREALFIEDDDDEIENAAGEWGYLRNSSSFGSGVYKSRDKSNDEHKRAMKNVLDSHFRALVTQLLQVGNIYAGDENDQEGWLEIITALSWEAATMLKPDTSTGGQMDPGGYVKVKCLASGHQSQSMVVRGIVCKKNVAHRRMASKFEKARLLILGGALEYQRVSTALSSIETLLQQEMDHLKMAVAKIEAQRPDVLLVEKSVSRYAQEYLLEKNISLVLNIKRPLLERIARCSGGQIVPSIDQLSSQKLGYCDEFHVEKFLEEHGSAGQNGKKLTKTLMYFEGCPKPLGCTILLRGANGDELKKVKHVVQYGVFAAYHLALETSFLADEGATLPILPLESPITVALPDKSSIERSISTVPGFTVPEYAKSSGPQSGGEPHRLNSAPTSDLVEATVVSVGENKYERPPELPDIMSSPYVPPLSQLKDEGFQPSLLNEPSGDLCLEDFSVPLGAGSETGRLAAEGVTRIINDFRAVQSEIMDSDANRSVLNLSPVQRNEKQIPEEQPTVKEEFLPPSSDNQSILVSLSSRCVWKGTVCERSHLFRIKYYGNFDKPLGRFLRDDLFDQNYRCRSCDMPAEAHIQCYTHRQGTLTISVKKMPEMLLPGEKDGKIWMWHRCLKCPRDNGFPPATRRVVMSDAAWGLSFGKFLELSFSNHAAASRVASCGHSLHRDCLRFYGFGRMVACFRYASIDVHSVYLPPAKLDFNFESQEWIEKELNELVTRGELLFAEVLDVLHRLASRNSDSSLPSSGFVQHLEKMETQLMKEKSEFEESVHKISSKGGELTYDILEINRLRRQLVFQAYVWDQRLVDGEREASTKQTSLAVTEKPFDIPVVTKSGEMLNNSSIVSANASPDHPEGQAVFCLSDVPDAASAVESHLGVVTFKNNNASEPLESELDSLSTGMSVKLDFEEPREGPTVSKDTPSSLFLSSRGSETTEDNMSWLGISFMNFYRSLNNNFSGSAQKLDKFRDYKPMYIFQESELQGGARFLLPMGVNDTVVPVYDDEPTSIISYVLLSPNYHAQVSEKVEKSKEAADPILSMQSRQSSSFQLFHSFDETVLESYKTIGSGDEPMSSSAISHSSLPLDPAVPPNLHPRVSFMDDGPLGKVKYTVTCYYAKEFESLRKMCCPLEIDFVRSLSRCKKWGAQGGKSNVFFAKTLDDRFIIKQVTKTELESFMKFGTRYFKYLTESISTGSPTCLAKILGIYQVASKHLKGGKEMKMDMLVMENLLFRRNVTRLYDLKGSVRSRYNPDSSGSNKVLLDQNLIEAMPTSPIFVGNKAKRLLERAVWNDTAFLALIDVMDYSLLVGVDEEKHELVLGIIDFMRQYTWDKHLETWVKASGILGGSSSLPTVISPKQYKTRFRKAMTTYFLMVPDQWSPATIVPSKSQTDLFEGNSVQSTTTSGE